MAGQPVKRLRKAASAAKGELAGGKTHKPHNPKPESVKAREDGTAIYGHPKALWDALLVHLADVGRTDLACKKSGIPKSSCYRRNSLDEDFAKLFAEARTIGYQRLEDEAFRRATDGVSKPIMYKGEQVASVTEHSDSLLMFMLEANNRRYAKKPLELTGPNGGPIPVSHDASAKLLDMLNRRTPADPKPE